MSNGAIAAACCCQEGCETDCCAWWACSPTGAITVTLSGSAVTNRKILPSSTPTTLAVEEVYWTITATMTKSGTTCDFAAAGAPSSNWPNLFRYSAQTVDFSYQRITRNYDLGAGATCVNTNAATCCRCSYTDNGCAVTPSGNIQGAPCGPCSGGPSCADYGICDGFDRHNPCLNWNCLGTDCGDGTVPGADTGAEGCTDCRCPSTVDELVWKLIETREYNWTGTMTSAGSCGDPNDCGCDIASGCDRGAMAGFPVPYNSLGALARAGDILTIVCVEGYCKEGCAKPVLVFRPQTVLSTANGTEEWWAGGPGTGEEDPCCVDCEGAEFCYTSQPWAPCVTGFAVIGRGNCLNGSTFDAPSTGCDWMPVPHSASSLCLSNGVDMAGIGCSSCTVLDGTFTTERCVETAYKGSPYFCAKVNADAFIPCLDPNGEFVEGSVEVCYWPAWCESDERTVQWTWAM